MKVFKRADEHAVSVLSKKQWKQMQKIVLRNL